MLLCYLVGLVINFVDMSTKTFSFPIAVLTTVLVCLTGCQGPTPGFQAVPGQKPDPAQTESVKLREGDIVRIDFPGAPNLNTRQQISLDGKISLSLVGEVVAAGKTPHELEAELKTLYASQVVSKVLTVSVESSSYQYFVTGAVLRPGPYTSSRPISVLEAVMQAGGFDETRANKKAVRISREVNGHVETHVINLKKVLEGRDPQIYYLKPSDIVYVPEKFQWF